MGGMI